ncbi:MAG: type I glyceraldehyde-3-phosphate dehydrogenase [Fretibacterium sp.]|nr:type I glyceraldehyde-3-phosphate dehydrogenase [Fretibacterium sp.]
MAVRVAINGFGRIGRTMLRCWMEHNSEFEDVEIVGLNHRSGPEEMAYYLKYDSIHRKAPFDVEADPENLILNGKKIPMFVNEDPAQIPWKQLDVDIVLESTGRFTKKADAMKHVEAGARYVIISAPSESADLTIVMGVNEEDFDPKTDIIVSNASCTTNCIAPATKVMHKIFGIEHLLATTVHAYTSTQNTLDHAKKGVGRRSRAAAVSLIPTTTGAARAMIPLFPDLNGKMAMSAIRVPTVNGSLTDVGYLLKKSVTVEEVNETLKKAAEGPLKGILEYSEDELVSVDIIGNPHSCIVDGLSTKVVDGRLVGLMLWYDNEYGYSKRMLDLAAYMGGKI